MVNKEIVGRTWHVKNAESSSFLQEDNLRGRDFPGERTSGFCSGRCSTGIRPEGTLPSSPSPFLSSFLSFFPFNSLFLLTSFSSSRSSLLSLLLLYFLFTSYIPLFILFIPLLLVSRERDRTERVKRIGMREAEGSTERERERERTAASLAFLEEFHPRTCRMTIQVCKLPTFYWVSRYVSIMVSPPLTFGDAFRIISVELRSEHCGINGRYVCIRHL